MIYDATFESFFPGWNAIVTASKIMGYPWSISYCLRSSAQSATTPGMSLARYPWLQCNLLKQSIVKSRWIYIFVAFEGIFILWFGWVWFFVFLFFSIGMLHKIMTIFVNHHVEKWELCHSNSYFFLSWIKEMLSMR